VAGDSDIAQAVADLANTVFSTGAGDAINGTFSESYSDSITSLGQTLSTTNDKVSNQTTISKLVSTQRDSVSGVSMDEEMADLIKYQQAFQASSRVVQTVDTLLSTVINSLGSTS
jgi:flagellar hook-associated protein 1 FlgK